MVLMDAVLRQRARMGAPCKTLGPLGHGEGTAAKRLAVPWWGIHGGPMKHGGIEWD